MFGRLVKDLHGNIFSVKDWRLYIAIPLEKFERVIFTKDHLSQIDFNLGITHKGNYYGFDFSLDLNLYIGYKFILEDYDESLDIRKSYLWTKKRK